MPKNGIFGHFGPKISKLKLMLYETVGPSSTKLGVNISHMVRHLYLEFENFSFNSLIGTLPPVEMGRFLKKGPQCSVPKLACCLLASLALRGKVGRFGASRASVKTEESLIPT